ncbi:hypothetical protein PIB30_025211 [Stylosanthes scabra]|uniref:DUF4216 domain-containing protein n=1 Tax=Stylosanthes scabra TaxID=79078 RepID=A0ABU6QA78_9FABA|nr:hypothetical protein [Stylosanthes scabra]
MSRLCYKDEPFVLATQAESVYYIQHSSSAKWHTIIKAKPRGSFSVLEDSDTNDQESEPYQLNELAEIWIDFSQYSMHNDNDLITRNDIAGVSVDEDIPIIEEEEEDDSSSSNDEEFDEDHDEEEEEFEELDEDDWI